MRLEKILESLKNCEPDKALIYAEDALKFAKEQCGNSVPSSGHGYLEELAWLYRVRTMQWEDAEVRARPDTRTLIEKVQDAQVEAGEQAVMANLKRMGF